MEDRPIEITSAGAREKLAGISFHSATYRLFKLPELEPVCEDYGQAVSYRGTVPHHANSLRLDKHHHIDSGRVFPVFGNTYRMLNETRFRDHFEFHGDGQRHFGIFPGCGRSSPFDETPDSAGCC